MKKLFVILSTAIFLTLLFFSLRIDSRAKGNDVSLENIEALACYTLEGSPFFTQCCEPWYYFCWNFNGVSLPGWPS